MRELTKKQLKLLKFIAGNIIRCGVAPSIREMGAHIDCSSTNNVAEYLDRIERKGMIARDHLGRHAKSRTMRVTRLGWEALDLAPKSTARIVGVTLPSFCAKCGSTTFAPERRCTICRVMAEEAA